MLAAPDGGTSHQHYLPPLQQKQQPPPSYRVVALRATHGNTILIRQDHLLVTAGSLKFLREDAGTSRSGAYEDGDRYSVCSFYQQRGMCSRAEQCNYIHPIMVSSAPIAGAEEEDGDEDRWCYLRGCSRMSHTGDHRLCCTLTEEVMRT